MITFNNDNIILKNYDDEYKNIILFYNNMPPLLNGGISLRKLNPLIRKRILLSVLFYFDEYRDIVSIFYIKRIYDFSIGEKWLLVIGEKWLPLQWRKNKDIILN